MLKSIIKEILLTIVLIAVILLVLAIVLYDYNPIVKTIPEAVKYEISKEDSEEINTEVIPNDTKVIITYEVDNTDLNNSEDYNPGKRNPFIKSSSSEAESSNGTGNSNSITSNDSFSNSNNSGYFQNTSTK